MKQIELHSADEIKKYKDIIEKAAKQAKQELDILSDKLSPIGYLEKIKYEKIGCDPLVPERNLNLIEQVNQTFTYLASLNAVRYLYSKYEYISSYRLNLGTCQGSDIEAYNGSVAAEVFAATNPSSNQKLKKDIAKVKATTAKNKFVFFSCPGIPVGPYTYQDETDVMIYSLGIYSLS